MVGASRYKLASEILKKFSGEILSLKDLQVLVMQTLASKENVVAEYLKMMDNTGLIREISHRKFKIL